jgi:hypothetical protein
MAGVIALGVVVAEAVERNQDDIGLRELLRGIRAVINGNDGSDGLPVRRNRQPASRKREAEGASPNAFQPTWHKPSPAVFEKTGRTIRQQEVVQNSARVPEGIVSWQILEECFYLQLISGNAVGKIFEPEIRLASLPFVPFGDLRDCGAALVPLERQSPRRGFDGPQFGNVLGD